jgi:two-component sensor histidine kinase
LVLGTLLPLLLFAVGLVYVYHQRDREAAFDRVLETVRGIRLVLDAELGNLTAGLEVLALSQALQHDDIDGFRQDALAFARRFPPESSVLLADRTGHQLVNTRVPAGTPLPERRNLESTEEVFRTGKPVYSRLFTGSVIGTKIITIEVPVMRDGKIVYTMSFNPPVSLFQRMVEEQRPSDDWTISIFDHTGTNLARVPNPEQTVGQRASPTLFEHLFRSYEAKIETVSLEGVPLLTAFTRSPLTGWTVAAGISATTLTAPLWRTVAITSSIGGALLIIGLFFAVSMATRIVRGEALHALLINELDHRVKNTLASVQSIAAQTFQPGINGTEARRKFEARLMALARAHSMLNAEKWRSADVATIVDNVMEPYDRKRVRSYGPEIRMSPTQTLMLSLVLHELATNALKYGALSNSQGKIDIDWHADDKKTLVLTWRESDGPPVEQSSRKGFGSRLITSGLASSGGSAEIAFTPTGVVCTIRCPVVTK